MADQPEQTRVDSRKNDLAKIHIAKKDLALDDDTYRTIVRSVGKAESGSAADLSALGRVRLLQHFKSKGWKTRRRAEKNDPKARASEHQVNRIRDLWINLADAGVVHDRTDQGLRAWTKSATRRYHPHHAGYSAVEFVPAGVAQRLIEHLKQWSRRTGVE